MTAAEEELIAELKRDRVVPVVGAGVSRQTAGLHHWRGLLESALDHVESARLGTADEIGRARTLVEQGNLTAAAQIAKRLLGAPAGEYPNWLKQACAISNRLLSKALIRAIGDLTCPLVATTNYDRLLTHVLLEHPEPVAWSDPIVALEALREGGRVLHLHGIYTKPESVVFGIDNYAELAANAAYTSVLETLWLSRTLLFIGCSFDGLQDPDFARLLEWAAAVFRGAPSKHFALMLDSSVPPEVAREFLLKWRIHVIPYGPTHDALAGVLRTLNPHAARAAAMRARVLRDLVDSHSPGARDLIVDAISDLPPVPMRWDAVADALLADNRATLAQMRADLKSLQALARTIISPEAIRTELSRYLAGDVTEFDGSFADVAGRAHQALRLMPAAMLSALKRRDVQIHQNWFSGDCTHDLDFLTRVPTALDPYWLENVSRILTSLAAVLESDPDILFEEPSVGESLEPDTVGTYLLVTRADRLELRTADAACTRLAMLPFGSGTGVRGASVVTFDRNTAVVAFTREQVIAWDPRRAAAPLASYSVNDAYGVIYAEHAMRGEALVTVLSTASGMLYELEDLALRRAHNPFGTAVLHPVMFDDSTVYGVVSGPGVRIESIDLGPTLRMRRLIDEDWLNREVQKLPDVLRAVTARQAADQKLNPDLAENTVRFDHPTLASLSLAGTDLLSLSVKLDFMSGSDSLLLLVDPREGVPRVAGHFLLPDRTIVGTAFTETSRHQARVTYSLLSNFKQTYDLVGWCTSVDTALGTMFVPGGSTIRTHDDMLGVAVNGSIGFASDDSGGLFTFSFDDASFAEVERDKRSRIRQVDVLQLTPLVTVLQAPSVDPKVAGMDATAPCDLLVDASLKPVGGRGAIEHGLRTAVERWRRDPKTAITVQIVGLERLRNELRHLPALPESAVDRRRRYELEQVLEASTFGGKPLDEIVSLMLAVIIRHFSPGEVGHIASIDELAEIVTATLALLSRASPQQKGRKFDVFERHTGRGGAMYLSDEETEAIARAEDTDVKYLLASWGLKVRSLPGPLVRRKAYPCIVFDYLWHVANRPSALPSEDEYFTDVDNWSVGLG